MSWSSRFPSLGGRWSPFGGSSGDRPSKTQPVQVQDSDFSYINPDDLDPPTSTTSSSYPKPSATPSAPRPSRDTDVLIFRHNKSRYPVHFPAYGISDGQITVGDLRAQAAKKLNVVDSKRVRMFYKGRNLKDDRAACRVEGLSSDVEGEILCVIGDANVPAPEDGDSDSDSDGGAAVDIGIDEDGTAAAPKRKRNRSKKKKGKKTTGNNSSGTATPDHLATPLRVSSPATPLTPMAKLDAIANTFTTTLLPQCVAFTSQPPTDPAKRSFDHKRITETVLAQVLLKVDAVEVEGEEGARSRRKELVREVQGWLNRLDDVAKL